MRFARIGRAATPDYGRPPLLVPELLKLDRALVDPDRMQGIALQRPSACLWVEIGEQPSFRVFAGRAGGKPARHRSRAPDDVADPLAIEERQRIHKYEARDAVGTRFG